jgi:hypothetical protein
MVGRIEALSEPLRTSPTLPPCMSIARLTMYSPRQLPLPLPLLSPCELPRAGRERLLSDEQLDSPSGPEGGVHQGPLRGHFLCLRMCH